MKQESISRRWDEQLQRWLITGLSLLCLSYVDIAAAQSAAATTTSADAKPADTRRYTFSWPIDSKASTPRGGTTQGAPVTLDTTPSAAWQALHAVGITAVERDRRAILAMAGSYRATFDFLEVLTLNGEADLPRPYQSWGTEKVYVESDTARSISLVHILEMRIKEEDGSISEPIVMKHWRQDWHYEPEVLDEYRGNAVWQQRKLLPAERKGQWVQTVYQVDESPRYAGVGKWQHDKLASTWISGDTWRPLPRREWSSRKDYDVLIGTNRHTITATGWVQEENNLKSVSSGNTAHAIAREYGVARYQRISDFDFSQADEYFNRTQKFWNQVRSTWDEWFKRDATIKLRGQVDQLGLFGPLFEYADAITDASAPAATNQPAIDKALSAMRP
jgi:hypothetical protein